MTSFSHKNITFGLQEGPDYENDLLDYSLVMLFSDCREILQSPKLPSLRPSARSLNPQRVSSLSATTPGSQ